MGFARTTRRNKLKKAQSNNKIKNVWRYYQIEKYGIGKWCRMYNASKNIKNKEEQATPKTAYFM